MLRANVAGGTTCGIVLQCSICAGGHEQRHRGADTGIGDWADIASGATRRGIGHDLVVRTGNIRKIDGGTGWANIAGRTTRRRIVIQDRRAVRANGHDEGDRRAGGAG